MLEGIVAEFDSPESLVTAYESLRRRGYTRLSTWTPYPVRDIVNTFPVSPIAAIMLVAGICGAIIAYAVQWWCNARDYPIDVGGRPLNSVVAFIPITFETTVLAAALAGFFATIAFSGLPRLCQPLETIEGFERATVDRFWLGVDATDPLYDPAVQGDLALAGALRCERLGARP